MPVLIVAVVLGVVLSHTAPFPFLFEVFFGNSSIWRAHPGKGQKAVYLTFDDGPNPTVTPELLDLLKDQDVHATFFLLDEHLNEETMAIVRRMFEEGHAVGHHSANRWLMFRSSGGLVEELQSSADRITREAGHRPCRVFRPHAGWRSIAMLRGVSRAKYKLIGWSWMSWDWVWFRERTGPRVAAQIAGHAAPGKIIVIHDGHHRDPRADRRYALEATRLIVDRLRADGYGFVTFCEPGSSEPAIPE